MIVQTLLLCLFFYYSLARQQTYIRSSSNSQLKECSRAIQTDSILRQAFVDGSVFMIDGDNVRGKTRFSLTKERVCEILKFWAGDKDILRKMVIYFDHAEEQSAFLTDSGLSIVFSGPVLSADDVICRDIKWLHSHFLKDVVLITDDQELKQRCRRSKIQSIKSIGSTLFADLLMSTARSMSTSDDDAVEKLHFQPQIEEVPDKELISYSLRFQVEFNLRQKMKKVQNLLARSSRSKQAELRRRYTFFENQLNNFLSTITPSNSSNINVTSMETSQSIHTDNLVPINPLLKEQGFKLHDDAFQRLLSVTNRKEPEETWERIILAENFRRTLIHNTAMIDMNNTSSSAMATYVNQINSNYSKK